MNERNAVAQRLVVYVSVLNWNAAEATLACLESLFGSRLPSGVEMRVFVVDNASAEQDWCQLRDGVHMHAVQLQRNAVETAFVSTGERATLIEQFTKLLPKPGSSS